MNLDVAMKLDVLARSTGAYIASAIGEDAVVVLRLDGTFNADNLRQLAEWLDKENE